MSRLTTWLLSLAVATATSCSPAEPDIPAAPTRREAPKNGSSYGVRVDRDFMPAEAAWISRAFHEWEQATSGAVRFDVSWNQDRPGPYRMHSKPGADDGFFVWSLDEEERVETPDPPTNWLLAMGVMVYGPGGRSGNLVLFQAMPEDAFQRVALHEVGHLIGLDHAERGAWSVMEPTADGWCISGADSVSACAIHGCVARPGCPRPGE